MKQHLNTLFVTTQGSYLAKEGEAVVVKVDRQVKLRVPVINLGGIVCFGHVGVSPGLMGLCGERGVAVTLLSWSGRFRAKVDGFTSGNVLLRRRQYRAADDPAAATAVARAAVAAKVANGRSVLLRALRDNPTLAGRADVEAAARRMAGTLEQLQADAAVEARTAGLAAAAGQVAAVTSAQVTAAAGLARTGVGVGPAGRYNGPTAPTDMPTLDRLRGLEGEAANAYFAVFDHLIVAQKPAASPAVAAAGASGAAAGGTPAAGPADGFAFRTRSRRPPLDPVNALLSFLYAMLGHDARAACEACGLDPQVGFLHRDRPGRAGLALDLIEEFRPYLADRLALSLINRKQVSPGGFEVTETGAVRMDDATRRTVLAAYQKRKQEEVVHPYLGERVSVGLLVHLQARLLARHVRGELDAYPAFVWK